MGLVCQHNQPLPTGAHEKLFRVSSSRPITHYTPLGWYPIPQVLRYLHCHTSHHRVDDVFLPRRTGAPKGVREEQEVGYRYTIHHQRFLMLFSANSKT